MTSKSNYAVRPGEYVQEFLEDKGMTPQEFAVRAGLTHETIEDVLSENPPKMTMMIAEGLSRAMPVAPSWWLRLDDLYRKDKERLGL